MVTVISVLLIGVATVILYILVQKWFRSPAVHRKNTDSEDISKKLSSSYKPLLKSDDDSSEQISNIEKQFCDQKHRFSQFDDDLFMLVELTELDKLVLDNLISKCILMIEDREEIIKPISQSERNMVFLDILTERPYDTFKLFKDVLKESDPFNDDVQELLNKIHWPENSDENISCHDIIMFDHIVKLQKNYMMFVRDADCKTDLADHLYEADILNTKEREEICNTSISRHESNRTLFKILLRKGGNAYKLLFEALRDEKWYDLATKMETTRISQQEIQLCQIGKKKFRERQKERDMQMIHCRIEELVRTNDQHISKHSLRKLEKRLQDSYALGKRPIKILSIRKMII
ncbi:uncharacterized protein LOC127710515 [Mytilus californianus]|uniref:uncharacterized protein LOC127710515 n=1 Tax=Mytilus californianus TaxID=6549 RepID=UPI002246AC42|nr:uncharacterized protein LOC127710515 [Mytilus californianus]